MSDREQALRSRLSVAFEAWFKPGSVDFWNEANAPDELAEVAVSALEALSRGTEWHPIETAPRDDTSILLLTRSYGVVEARYSPGEWHDYLEGREYDGPVWVCADDQFQLEIEVTPDEELCEQVLGWLPRETLPPASCRR